MAVRKHQLEKKINFRLTFATMPSVEFSSFFDIHCKRTHHTLTRQKNGFSTKKASKHQSEWIL